MVCTKMAHAMLRRVPIASRANCGFAREAETEKDSRFLVRCRKGTRVEHAGVVQVGIGWSRALNLTPVQCKYPPLYILERKENASFIGHDTVATQNGTVRT